MLLCRPELYPPADLLPPNVELVVGDLLQSLPEKWAKHFDLVHQRFVFPGFPAKAIDEFVDKLMECVKPGGWIQFVEPVANENVSGPGPSAFAILHQLANTFMKSPNPTNVILAKLESAGFINVNIETLDIVVGKYQSNKELDARGRRNMRATINNMLAFTKYCHSPQQLIRCCN